MIAGSQIIENRKYNAFQKNSTNKEHQKNNFYGKKKKEKIQMKIYKKIFNYSNIFKLEIPLDTCWYLLLFSSGFKDQNIFELL